MVKLSVEQVLLFVVLAFLLYHLLGNCYRDGLDGFSVGGDAHNETNFEYGSYICGIIDQKYKDNSYDKIKKCKCLDAGCYFAKNDNHPSVCYFDARVKNYETPEEYYNHYLNNDKQTPELGLCSENINL